MKFNKQYLLIAGILILTIPLLIVIFAKKSAPITASLSASPSSITRAGDVFRTARTDTAERSVLSVDYKNNTSAEMKNIKVVVSIGNYKTRLHDILLASKRTASTHFNKKESVFDAIVIDVPDLKPGEKGHAEAFLIVKNPDHITAKAVVKANGNFQVTDPVTITVK